MNRRSALKTLSCGLGALAANGAWGASLPRADGANSPVYRFEVGGHACHSLWCGELETAPRQPFFAPEATQEAFATAVRQSVPRDRLQLPYNVLLVEWDGRHVLVDTGPASVHGGPPPIVECLARLGLSPADISVVILTHAHFDHQGGLLTADGQPVFRSARHHVFQAEIDFWTAEQPDFSALRMDGAGMLAAARAVFAHLDFIPAVPGRELLPGLVPYLFPGHTPGHMTLRFSAGADSLYHLSDLCHHADLLLPHPDWTVGSDVLPAVAAQSRRTVFGQVAKSGERVFGFHLPFPGLGWITAADGAYRWIPEAWSAHPRTAGGRG